MSNQHAVSNWGALRHRGARFSWGIACLGGSLLAGAAGATTLDAPTFVDQVAPLLHQNCAGCHRPGDIAPMSLRSYDEVRPWAKSIARVVADREMPPWDADPGFGPWANDISLSEQEIDTITRWVAAGAPRGAGDQPPLPEPADPGAWRMGEPDWVWEFDEVAVSADGPDQFAVVPITNPFGEDRWITGIEVIPGDPAVVHHFILWRADESNHNQESWMSGWAAGAPQTFFPEGTARFLPAGRSMLGDFHYHPSGEATTDKTRVGFHFAKAEEVEKELVNLWILNAEFKIPAGDPNYRADASHTFTEDVRILSLAPHMHYRGKDMSYTAVLPDGTSKELLRVSNYDFAWQTGYDFVEPVDLPAGSRIDVVAHWDNSPENPDNPDPTKDVTFGTDSTDEMLIGFADYVVQKGRQPQLASPVIAKLIELSGKYPGEVWRIDTRRTPGGDPEPMAIHLPKNGNPGGWYVKFGNLALPAQIHEVQWEGNRVTAKAFLPGQDPVPLVGVLDEKTGELALEMMGGTMLAQPAARERAVLPGESR
jgi:hypothetical protein